MVMTDLKLIIDLDSDNFAYFKPLGPKKVYRYSE